MDDYRYAMIKMRHDCVETLACAQHCLNIYYKEQLVDIKFYIWLVQLEKLLIGGINGNS